MTTETMDRSGRKETMFSMLDRFMKEPQRQENYMASDQAMSYYRIYKSRPRDDAGAVVDPGPADLKRLKAVEERLGQGQAASAPTTKPLIMGGHSKAQSLLWEKHTTRQGAEAVNGNKNRPGQ